MSRRAPIATVLLLPIIVSAWHARAAEPTLEILNAAASQAEDGPPVAHDYQFLPGDIVYFSFQIAHFAVKRDTELDTAQIDLSYEIAFEDAKGVLLANPVADQVAVQLNSEDKNWLPKRRASFQIPDLVAAGDYQVSVTARDAFAHRDCSTAVPIHIGGEHITPSDVLNIQQFRFVRDENDTTALTVAAYRPGDTVFTRFDIAGFAVTKANEYRVQYGLTVLGPNGKPFVQDENAATMRDSTFYPAQYVPATLQVITKPSSARGVYTLILKVRDLVGNRSCEVKQVFSLE